MNETYMLCRNILENHIPFSYTIAIKFITFENDQLFCYNCDDNIDNFSIIVVKI